MIRRFWSLAPALFLSLALCSFSRAADTIWWRDEQGRETRTEGRIESLTGQNGLFITAVSGAAVSGLPFTKVLRLETTRTPSHEKGDRLFDEAEKNRQPDRYAEALDQYRQARQGDETRQWVRVWLTWRISLCCQRLGRNDDAVREFLLLGRMDPYTPFWESTPLVWGSRSLTSGTPDAILAIAKAWLSREGNPAKRESPVSRLLAASLLLEEGDSLVRRQAMDSLRELAVLSPADDDSASLRDVKTGVALLALAQLARLQITGPANSSADSRVLKQLQTIADRLPVAARSGVELLLAKGWQRQGDRDRAEDHFRRAAFSCWSPPTVRNEAEKSLELLNTSKETP